MTRIAGFNSGYMVGRLATGKLTVMAFVTLLGKCFKNTANMTTLAIDNAMNTFQGKSRYQMIKGIYVDIFPGGRCIGDGFGEGCWN